MLVDSHCHLDYEDFSAEGVEEIVISPEVVEGGARPLRIYSERAEEKGTAS